MSAFTEQLFTDLAAAPLWDVAVSIKRGNPLPLDKDSIVRNQAGLDALKNSAVSYPGQIVAAIFDAVPEVKEGDEVVTPAVPEKVVLYYLDQNKNPQLVSPEVEIPEVPVYNGDNKAIVVGDDYVISLVGATAANKGKVAMLDDNGNLVWKTLEEIGAGDGNDNTTYEFTAELSDDGQDKLLGFKVEEYHNGVLVPEKTFEVDLSSFARLDDISGIYDDIGQNYYTKNDTDNAIKTAIGDKSTEMDPNGTGLWASLNVELAKKADKDTTYTKTEVDTELGKKADASNTYTKSEVNDAIKVEADKVVTLTGRVDGIDEDIEGINGEITNIKGTLDTKANSDDVYGKTEVYTKTEADAKIAELIAEEVHLKRVIIEAPVFDDNGALVVENAEVNVIYMAKTGSLSSGDNYEEWMLIDGAMIQIGDTTVDLTPYAKSADVYTKDEVDNKINPILEDYVTEGELQAVEGALGDRIDGVIDTTIPEAIAGVSKTLTLVLDKDAEGNVTQSKTYNSTEDVSVDIDAVIEARVSVTDQQWSSAIDNIIGSDGLLEVLQKDIDDNYYTKDEIDTTLEGYYTKDGAAEIFETKADALITKNTLSGEIAGISTNLTNNYYDKSAINGLIGTPGKPAEKDEEGNIVVQPVAGTGIFVDTYSKSEINSLLDEIEGGSTESAASVARQLDEYKGKNDARVKEIEDILNDTENSEGGNVPGLVSRVEANEDAIADILDKKLTAKADQAAFNELVDRVDGLDDIYATNDQLTNAVNDLTDLINGKVAQGTFDDLAEIVDEHTGTLTNHGTRIKTIEDVLPGLATTESVNTTLADYAKTADVANTYVTKTTAEGFATKAEITAANYVSYADTVVMNGGSAAGFSIN